jgi:putative sugar O-methyltransferase
LRIIHYLQQIIYKTYTASLYEFVAHLDTQDILKKIEEPLIGNPILISYKNKLITQDLCNSVYDYYAIVGEIDLPKKPKIAEIGAGYGRVAYVFLSILTNSSYCIIDIPPALFIAQNYLSKVFPDEKIFKFRPFNSYEEIRKEFEESRIRFLMPHQVKLLPKKYFDLFINISSLHEMTREQIKNYISQINLLCKGYFYTKQWRKSRTKDNNFITEQEYPTPKNWKVVQKRSRHPIQKMFFDTLYKIK